VIRKTIVLILLASFAAIVTHAFAYRGDATGQDATNKSAPPTKDEKGPPRTSSNEFANKEPSSKTFPTSSQLESTSRSSTSAGRRELVIERGLVTLIDDNRVPATEAGMLIDVKVKEGNSVEEGTLLAEIDTRTTLAKQRIAQGERDAAMAQAENDAELDVAYKGEEVSKAELDQIEEVQKSNAKAVSKAEWRKYYFQHEKAKAQIKQAVNEKEIARLTATAKQAQYDAATIELDLRQIRAPFKGQIVDVMKKKGDWVTVGEPIMHIVGLDRLRVRGFVQATHASPGEVLGKPVTITVYSAGDKQHTLKGIIGFASPVVDGSGSSRHFKIWAEVDNERSIDPVTKQESWKIEPGAIASMTIDLTPSAPSRPVAGTKSEPTKGKVQSFKPVTDENEKSNKATEKKTAKER
jgi:multidrug efflux pump subunit AcrA (membrane-fusion protein)